MFETHIEKRILPIGHSLCAMSQCAPAPMMALSGLDG